MTLLTSMLGKIRRVTESVRVLPVDGCYHYRGFRYGGFRNNLYEDYVVSAAGGGMAMARRKSFAAALLRCRPRTMDEALQLDLGGAALWDFPWASRTAALISPVANPADNPDPVCHYCEAGILSSHINREIGWLESALESIRTVGYLPAKFGFITVLELQGDASSSYVVVDGNHRLGAMHAIGVKEFQAKLSDRSRVRRSNVESWPGVVDGRYSIDRALAVFDRYFARANPELAELHPARLVVDEAPLWLDASIREPVLAVASGPRR